MLCSWTLYARTLTGLACTYLQQTQRDSPLSPEQQYPSEVGSPDFGTQQVPLVTVPHSIPERAQPPIVPRLVFQSPPKASTSKQTLDDPVRSAFTFAYEHS